MLKDPEQLETFIKLHEGFTEPVLKKLKENLDALNEERKVTLKDLILENRKLLDEQWTRCCYSDDQRAQFYPYNVDYHSEDVLGLHELELEEVQRFYYSHKRIFKLAQKHKELWDRHLQRRKQLPKLTDCSATVVALSCKKRKKERLFKRKTLPSELN